MAKSSIKICWSKLSARIRNYLDAVDSYYRPNAEDEENTDVALRSYNSNNLVSCENSHGDIRVQRGLITHGGGHEAHKSGHKRSSAKHDKPSAISGDKFEWRYKSPTSNQKNEPEIINQTKHHQENRHHRHNHGTPHSLSSPTSNNRSARLDDLITPQDSRRHYAHDHVSTHDYSQHGRQQLAYNGTSRLSQLGYTKRKTNQGQIYFVDANGNRDWHDPSVPKELIRANLDLDNLIGPLTSNWEVRRTSSGKVYYTNHLKCTTQLTDPRLIAYKDSLMTYLRRRSIPAYNEASSICSPPDMPSRRNQAYDQPPRPNQPSSRLNNIDHNLSGNPALSPRHSQLNTQISSSSTALSCLSSCQQQNSQNDSKLRRNPVVGEQKNTSTREVRPTIRQSIQNLDQLMSPERRIQENVNLFSGTLDTTRRRRQQATNSLFRGSHQNLSISSIAAGNSNTLTGPPPSWFGQPTFTPSRGDIFHRNATAVDTQYHTNNTLATQGHQTSRFECSRAPLEELPSNDPATSNRLIASMHNSSRQEPISQLEQPFHSPSNRTTLAPKPTNDLSSEENNRDNNRKELFDKISLLRQELLKQQDLTHPCKISISRKKIFEDSFRAVAQMSPQDLKKRLLIKFKGEEGLDYGGVAREWFHLLSKEILNPAHGLFQYTSDDIYNLQINPDSGIVYREHLTYLNFCGRIIGMAVFHGHFIEGRFTLPFYKMLLNKPIVLKDIEFVDPELHRSLCWILNNDITDVIDTTFSVQHNAFGQLQEYELKENGRNISVTEENKLEYVTLYVNYRCRRGIESQFSALQRGFYEIISPILVDNFHEAELELLIGGLSKIDLDDWRLNTKLKNCNAQTPLIVWFWDIVKSYDEDKRARLLQFVTGSPRVPIQGFKALQGVNSELRLFTIHMIRNGNTDNLPKSHTCFNRIDLPPYETYDKLRDKLTQAIEETMGFAMQ